MAGMLTSANLMATSLNNMIKAVCLQIFNFNLSEVQVPLRYDSIGDEWLFENCKDQIFSKGYSSLFSIVIWNAKIVLFLFLCIGKVQK